MINTKNNLTNEVEDLLILGFYLLIILSIWAVRTPGSTLGPEWLRTLVQATFYLLVAVVFGGSILTIKNMKLTIWYFLIALCPLIYWIIIHSWAYEPDSLALTTPIASVLFAIQPDNIRSKIYVLFKKTMLVVAVLGICSFIFYILKLPVPYSVAPYYDGRPYQNYANYFNISFLYVNSTGVRVCGIFNEPGWLGTILALIMCYEKFAFNKITNWIFFICGLLTFSLAFIIIIFLGFVLRNISNIRKWLPLVLVFIFFILILPNIKTNNDQVNKLIARMQITSEGLAGNNRSSGTVDTLLTEMLSSKKAFLGYGDGYAEYENSMHESKQILTIKTEIINFGIIGFFLMYVAPMFFFLFSAKSRKSIIFVICFWISLYQRPWLYILPNYMMLLSAIAFLNDDVNNQEEQRLIFRLNENETRN